MLIGIVCIYNKIIDYFFLEGYHPQCNYKCKYMQLQILIYMYINTVVETYIYKYIYIYIYIFQSEILH